MIMNKLSKLLLLLVVIVMIAGCLAACKTCAYYFNNWLVGHYSITVISSSRLYPQSLFLQISSPGRDFFL